jgi:predicted ester cyclase
LLHPKTTIHGLEDSRGKTVRGIKAFKEFHRQFTSAFPKLTVEVLDTIQQGDKIAARCLVNGRHGGDALGFPATKKTAKFTGMCFLRIKNGKFVEGWNNFDFLTLHRQLGTLKPGI